MALVRIKDWKSPNIDLYAMTTRKDVQSNAIQLEWLAPLNAEQIGTTLNETLWNELQEGIPQGIYESTYSANNYIANLKGLNAPLENEFITLFNGLEIKLKIPATNLESNPKILLNGHLIELKKFDEQGNVVEIVNKELSKNHIYNFIYHLEYNVFICRELSLLTTQAIDSIFARLNKKIDDLLAEILKSKGNFELRITGLSDRLETAINSNYIEEEHYKKSDIDKLLFLKEGKETNKELHKNKVNLSGNNITEKEVFRNNIEVYDKNETERKIIELSPRPENATRFKKGIINFQDIYDLIEEKVPNATETIKGKISINEIKSVIKTTVPNLKVKTFQEIIGEMQ